MKQQIGTLAPLFNNGATTFETMPRTFSKYMSIPLEQAAFRSSSILPYL